MSVSSVDMNFVPETLEQCKEHFVPAIGDYITCYNFGHIDGTNGSCHWCREMTPYQFEMCSDDSWVGNLIRGNINRRMSIDEAIQFIEDYKQRHKHGRNKMNEDIYKLAHNLTDEYFYKDFMDVLGAKVVDGFLYVKGGNNGFPRTRAHVKIDLKTNKIVESFGATNCPVYIFDGTYS